MRAYSILGAPIIGYICQAGCLPQIEDGQMNTEVYTSKQTDLVFVTYAVNRTMAVIAATSLNPIDPIDYIDYNHDCSWKNFRKG